MDSERECYSTALCRWARFGACPYVSGDTRDVSWLAQKCLSRQSWRFTIFRATVDWSAHDLNCTFYPTLVNSPVEEKRNWYQRDRGECSNSVGNGSSASLSSVAQSPIGGSLVLCFYPSAGWCHLRRHPGAVILAHPDRQGR